MILNNKNILLSSYLIYNEILKNYLLIIINNKLDKVVLTQYTKLEVDKNFNRFLYIHITLFLWRYFQFYSVIHNIEKPDITNYYMMIVWINLITIHSESSVKIYNLIDSFLLDKTDDEWSLEYFDKKMFNYKNNNETVINLPDEEIENLNLIKEQYLSGDMTKFYPEYSSIEPILSQLFDIKDNN